MITGAVPPDTMVSLALPLPPEASAAALVTFPDVLTTATGDTFGVAGPSTYCCQSGFVGQGTASAAAARPPLSTAAASAITASAASHALRGRLAPRAVECALGMLRSLYVTRGRFW